MYKKLPRDARDLRKSFSCSPDHQGQKLNTARKKKAATTKEKAPSCRKGGG